jgi:preprotein translocase subunit SecD
MFFWFNKFRIAVVALQLLTASIAAARAQQITLDVDRAEASRSHGGSAALTMYLSPDSRLAFGNFTSAYVGRFVDVIFLNEVLTRIRLWSSIEGGVVQIGGGKIDEQSAADLAQQLSSPSSKVDVRISD